ncbi:hypothetical protein KPH14_000961 [Odynerus spinipes]|uniref:Chymotrypsin-2 n=1 Tax=Odynerus spinipes TaxID=1348599 RepID=A0AAD9REW1_9HYME|nr:hypothetical protein KPH14_000961 [Odynerus spinipes]
MAFKAVLLLGLVAACYGATIPLFEPRVVNGEDAQPGEIPYQVSLQTISSSFHFCGGSVLSKNYVITAAHCVDGKLAADLKVIAGTINLNTPNSVHRVEKIMVHEMYAPYDSWRNDIALLKVYEPFVESKLLSYVPMPSTKDVINANDVAVVSGWGRLWQGGPTTTKLQRVNIVIADQGYCRSMYNKMSYAIYDTHVCAYNPESSKGSCNGDSGGPLTVNGKLVGLVSWAKACALTDYPTVYTRVSEYLDWIATHAV